MTNGYRIEPPADAAGTMAKARALVSHVAAGLPPYPDVKVSASAAASSVGAVLLAVIVGFGLTEDDAETAAALAIQSLKQQGFFDPPGGRPTVKQ